MEIQSKYKHQFSFLFLYSKQQQTVNNNTVIVPIDCKQVQNTNNSNENNQIIPFQQHSIRASPSSYRNSKWNINNAIIQAPPVLNESNPSTNTSSIRPLDVFPSNNT